MKNYIVAGSEWDMEALFIAQYDHYEEAAEAASDMATDSRYSEQFYVYEVNWWPVFSAYSTRNTVTEVIDAPAE